MVHFGLERRGKKVPPNRGTVTTLAILATNYLQYLRPSILDSGLLADTSWLSRSSEVRLLTSSTNILRNLHGGVQQRERLSCPSSMEWHFGGLVGDDGADRDAILRMERSGAAVVPF